MSLSGAVPLVIARASARCLSKWLPQRSCVIHVGMRMPSKDTIIGLRFGCVVCAIFWPRRSVSVPFLGSVVVLLASGPLVAHARGCICAVSCCALRLLGLFCGVCFVRIRFLRLVGGGWLEIGALVFSCRVRVGWFSRPTVFRFDLGCACTVKSARDNRKYALVEPMHGGRVALDAHAFLRQSLMGAGHSRAE